MNKKHDINSRVDKYLDNLFNELVIRYYSDARYLGDYNIEVDVGAIVYDSNHNQISRLLNIDLSKDIPQFKYNIHPYGYTWYIYLDGEKIGMCEDSEGYTSCALRRTGSIIDTIKSNKQAIIDCIDESVGLLARIGTLCERLNIDSFNSFTVDGLYMYRDSDVWTVSTSCDHFNAYCEFCDDKCFHGNLEVSNSDDANNSFYFAGSEESVIMMLQAYPLDCSEHIAIMNTISENIEEINKLQSKWEKYHN